MGYTAATLEDNMIELKIVSRQMVRSTKNCAKKEKLALAKLKKAIKQGNPEGARIYGEDVIRERNQSLQQLRLASRLDACCSRIETAVRMGQVTSSMKGVVHGMSNCLGNMDAEHLSTLMDKFEEQFEDLDVNCGFMDTTMNRTSAVSTPTGQVDELIGKVADEHNLELGEAFQEAGPVGKIQLSQTARPSGQEGDLEQRLANLRK